MAIERPFVVLESALDHQSPCEPAIEVDDVRIGVVQERARGPETQRHGQAAAEWLDEAPLCVQTPERCEMRHLPPLAAGPLEQRTKRWEVVGVSTARHGPPSVTPEAVA